MVKGAYARPRRQRRGAPSRWSPRRGPHDDASISPHLIDGPELPWGLAILITIEALVISVSLGWVAYAQLVLALVSLISSGLRSAALAKVDQTKGVVAIVVGLALLATFGVAAPAVLPGDVHVAALALSGIAALVGWLGTFPPVLGAVLTWFDREDRRASWGRE